MVLNGWIARQPLPRTWIRGSGPRPASPATLRQPTGDPHLAPRLRRLIRAGIAALPGPNVRLSLTAVQNLADACLAAPAWPAGAYNIADAEAYWRDRVALDVLRAHGTPARLAHVPIPAATLLARVAETLATVSPAQPGLTRYAVDQIARSVVLDISKAVARCWQPRHTLVGYLAALSRSARAGLVPG